MSDFVDMADKVSQQVKDIISGKVSIEDFDRIEREEKQMAESKKNLAEEAESAKWLKGRPGKGHKPGYEWYCARCQTEYLIKDITKCTHCGNEEM